MRQIKLTTALLLVAALSCVSFGFKACPQSEKDQNVAFARDLAGAFKAAGPIVGRKSDALAKRWASGADAAGKLIAAIAASNQTLIESLLREIMPVFTDVVDQFSNDENLLGYLALGQIALNFFVNHFLSQTSAARAPVKRGVMIQSGDDDLIRRFKALPQFGCQLRPERCR